MSDLNKWKKKVLEIVSKIDDESYEDETDLAEDLEKLAEEIFDETEDLDD